MVLLFGIPMPIAIGSSAFMVGLTALAGLLGHASIGHVNWHTALLLALPIFIGTQIGSRASIHIKIRDIKHLYGWFLVLIAMIAFLRVWRFI
ncbi:MAG: sulfite exporter TauE/SafE family protein [Candidatus Aminicenantes bacterium]|nr:sulfite exporter TauE/SafE family protein [Candidatus Aminicenantes bacterium]